MDNGTTLLLALEGLVAGEVTAPAEGVVVLQMRTSAQVEPRCPGCQVVSRSVKEWTTTAPRDLDAGGRRVRLSWRKRRWRCRNPLCTKASFTETVPAIRSGARLTDRLRQYAGAVVADHGRTVVQAARDLHLSWSTVHAAFAVHARVVLPVQPGPVTVLGIDETRRGRRRYARDRSPAASF